MHVYLSAREFVPSASHLQPHSAGAGTTREFRDVVFEDVGFENNSSLTLNN